jgi:hypothetical protein
MHCHEKFEGTIEGTKDFLWCLKAIM